MIVVGALVLAGVITVILLSARGGDSRLTPATAPVSAPSTTAESTKDSPGGGGSDGGARALPPPTQTGTAYQDEPDVGACVDIARGANGTVLYQADCTSPAASMILDTKQPQGQKCLKGFFGLRGFSGQIMCFTYKVAVGDCVDLDLLRRAACTPTPANGPKGKITITDVHPGALDGTSCADPTQYLRVVAELVLGAFLVVRGGGTPANPNPYRVGDGFPVPPPCSLIDRALVSRIIGSDDHQLTETYRLDRDDPVRTCAFKATRPELGTVTVTMFSNLIQGYPEVYALGLSELTPYDNLYRQEPKRYSNLANVTFEIDNLDVRVDYQYPARGDRFMPPPPEAQRLRTDIMTLTKQIAGKLTPRNKTGPTLPSIVPSTRHR